MQTDKQRNYQIDNIKCFLIFCVVFGHLIGAIRTPLADIIYRMIYSFHIPMFVFVSGIFAKFDLKKIFARLLYPYLIFQTVYLVFFWHWIYEGDVRLQYRYPCWLMWYLFGLAIFYLSIPVLEKIKSNIGVWMIMGELSLVSILSGYLDNVGYQFSLSRILVFAPFFAYGYYYGNREKFRNVLQKAEHHRLLKVLCPMIAAAMLADLGVFSSIKSRKILFNTYPYSVLDYGPRVRIEIIILVVCVSIILLKWIPDKKIKYITTIGQNTLPIYLSHGFLVKLLEKYQVWPYDSNVTLLSAFALALVCLFVFGSPIFSKCFSKMFLGDWIFALTRKSLEKYSKF